MAIASAPSTLRLGSLNLKTPKLRQGSYFPPFLEARKTTEKALVAVIQEAWIGGSIPRCGTQAERKSRSFLLPLAPVRLRGIVRCQEEHGLLPDDVMKKRRHLRAERVAVRRKRERALNLRANHLA